MLRVYQLAKELGLDTKTLIEKLKCLNFPVKSHMTVVDDETAQIIRHEIEDLLKKEIESNVVEVDFPITVKDLAIKLNLKPSQLLMDLMKENKLYNINQTLDEETARAIAYKYKVNLKKKPPLEEVILKQEGKDIRKRPPIVTLMGHIDHGKTSLLDYIRKSRIAQQETGGITQHIGSYQVKLPNGKITFLDTPGHETFTAMRARGANITDIVILVVAADEGIKPQTEEAISHARAANVPIIVAINKIDKPNANIDMVKQQLAKLDLLAEDWGGNTITVGVSAKTGEGISDLLDLILLQAETMELKASYDKPAVGVVIESKLSKGKGPVLDVIVREGIFRIGDFCVCGTHYGRIRAMYDDMKNFLKEAEPSSPVEIVGINGVVEPGEKIFVVEDEKMAKDVIEKRKEELLKNKVSEPVHFKLEDLSKQKEEDKAKELRIVLKADVGGTLEAVKDALSKFSTDEVKINIVHKSVGAINNSDVLLAETTDSIIVGFKVDADSNIRELIRQKGIQMRIYQIIYELLDDIKAALEGLLAPQIRRIFLGRAVVKSVFKLSKAGTIAGCFVQKGKILRGAKFTLYRDNNIIFEGKIQSLKRFKDDVREVQEGLECGINIGYDDIKENDIIDVFNEEVISRRLENSK